jgi:hypothetical protein
MKLNIFKHFYLSFFTTILGIVLAFIIAGVDGIFVASILAVLEISLSFDNAIVNAKVLGSMSEVWRKRFLTWGMLIAVFGMRLIFPILIVSIVGAINPIQAFHLAIYDPDGYAKTLESAANVISGFGGGFLLMVFLKFFFDKDKEVHWIDIIERSLVKVAKLESIEIAMAILATYIVSIFLPHEESYKFLVAGLLGIVVFLMVKGLGGLFINNNHSTAGTTLAKAGFASFIYLEVLDASFSFDGVIGAFALTRNIFIIMIGLGIGAMFVRSLTLLFVDRGTLSNFQYLENGAFWAIGVLAVIMYMSTLYHIPEVVTGLLGGFFILASLYASILYKRRS